MEQKEHPEDSKKPKKRPGSSEQKQKADSENTGRGLEFWLHRHPKSVSESYMHFYAKKQYEEEQRKRLGIPEQPKQQPKPAESKQKADSENTGRGLEFWLHRHPKSVSESYMHFYAKKQYEEEQRKRLGIPEQPKQQPKPSDKTQKAESENTGHSLEFWLHRHPKSVSESYMHFYAKKQYEEEQRKRSEDSKRAEPRQD